MMNVGANRKGGARCASSIDRTAGYLVKIRVERHRLRYPLTLSILRRDVLAQTDTKALLFRSHNASSQVKIGAYAGVSASCFRNIPAEAQI